MATITTTLTGSCSCCAGCTYTGYMFLPPLVEATGTWYVDCATAHAVLANTLAVSNCVGYCEGGPGQTSFTATDSGSTLTLAVGGVGAVTWGSLNLQATKTLTATATANNMQIKIYNDSGVLVEDSGVLASPWTSSALPYTGRYIIRALGRIGGGPGNSSITLSTSGTYSANPIRATYDSGAACPSTLDCGASC